MPLISGGALAAAAAQFGLRLPGFLSGGKGGSHQSGGYYGSKGYDREGGSLGGLSGLGSMAGMGGMGGMGNVGSLMSVAKAFL